MIEFDATNIKPWAKKRPILARGVMFLLIFLYPIIFLVGAIWDARDQAKTDIDQLLRMAFGKWTYRR